jgi:hypothetical protein
MSLAIYAAPFNDNVNNSENESNNLMNTKRQTHNKTQKNYPKESFDTVKVNSVLDQIHNKSKSDDEDDNLGDFNPPPKAESVGVHRTVATEKMSNMSNENNELMFRTLGRAPQPNYNGGDDLDLNNFVTNYGDNKSVDDYYKKMLPGYIPGKNPNMNVSQNNPVNRQYYNPNNNMSHESSNPDVLIQKLNYMISLLEEQQDEKTNNVTEEVVLYSFLGIFIIFVVDSFARVGKYIR